MKETKSKASRYPLSEEDVKSIIDATEKTRDKVIIELLAFTGCRREELTLLRFMDIKLDYDLIMMPTVKQEKMKPKKKKSKKKLTKEQQIKYKQERQKLAYSHLREIPIINNDLKRDLLTHMQEMKRERRIIETSRLIQSRQKESITEPMINNIVVAASEKANIKVPNPDRKHVHPHMFRHTFVRYARKYGLDYVTIQEIVGHSDISTTMGLYGRPTWEDKVEEAKKMKDFGR